MKDTIKTLGMLLEKHTEWLLADVAGGIFPLRAHEIEIEQSRNRFLLGFLDEKGFQTWRIERAEIKDEKFILNLARNFGREHRKIELVPRARAEALGEAVELARLEKANRIAQLLVSETADAKLIRTELNRGNGRFGEIMLETAGGRRIAALADVSGGLAPEMILSTAILKLVRLERRKKNPVTGIWLLSEKRTARPLQKLHACLRSGRKRMIRLKKIFPEKLKDKDEGEKELIADLKPLEIEDLWTGRPAKPKPAGKPQLSETARTIVRLAPGKIDHLFTGNGETLRFLGLPFVRGRKIFGEDKIWFGTGRHRRILNEESHEDFCALFETIERYRRFDSPNKQHAFYRDAPEAWLESLLRKNIRALDANLVLSPVYNQFRASRERIDLLALRRDGRLVIIELKVAPDREMLLQAVDYWQKIELQRRRGNLAKARLFGKRRIADRPALIYLAAPVFAYHPQFDLLAAAFNPGIGIYRFDLAENWRRELKVLQRKRVNKQ